MNKTMYQVLKVFNDGVLVTTQASPPVITLTNSNTLDLFGLEKEYRDKKIYQKAP